MCRRETIGLCIFIPLLAVVCALRTSGVALVTGVTRDTANRSETVGDGRGENRGINCTPYLRLAKSAAEDVSGVLLRRKLQYFSALRRMPWEDAYKLTVTSPVQWVLLRCCSEL